MKHLLYTTINHQWRTIYTHRPNNISHTSRTTFHYMGRTTLHTQAEQHSSFGVNNKTFIFWFWDYKKVNVHNNKTTKQQQYYIEDSLLTIKSIDHQVMRKKHNNQPPTTTTNTSMKSKNIHNNNQLSLHHKYRHVLILCITSNLIHVTYY